MNLQVLLQQLNLLAHLVDVLLYKQQVLVKEDLLLEEMLELAAEQLVLWN